MPVQVLDVREVGPGVAQPRGEKVADLIHRERFEIRLPGGRADGLVRTRRRLGAERLAVDEGVCGRSRLVHQGHRGESTALPPRDGNVRNGVVKVEVLTGQASHL